jgi:hypothetical protein
VLFRSPIGGVTVPFNILHVRDEKTSGTAGGASITGTQTRTINIVKLNEVSGASLNGSNQITLPAGTYEVDISCPVYNGTGLTKTRLYNVTDSVYLMEGGSLNCLANGMNFSRLVGVLTLGTTHVLEVRQYTQNIVATNGLGVAVSQGVEVYTDAIFRKRNQ